jgi:hypothetical protein
VGVNANPRNTALVFVADEGHDAGESEGVLVFAALFL